MGTSTAYGGPGGDTPLVPSWLEPAPGDNPAEISPPIVPPGEGVPLAPELPAIPVIGDPSRFTAARGNFTRFVNSGGQDTASLGRSVSGYVSTSFGGARQAAQHMGASRGAGARLVDFLSNVHVNGSAEALAELDLEGLSGRPIEEVFLGLADYVCPNVGTVDEGIARDAFVETIVELSTLGITDLDSLSFEQMNTVFEIYATHAIETRLCNDIGIKLITVPDNAQTAIRVQAQLRDFIKNGVSDALARAFEDNPTLKREDALSFVDRVYEDSFKILRALGEEEANL